MEKRFLRKVITKKTSHPRSHFTKKRNKWKPKVPYDCFEDAQVFLTKNNLKNYRAYLCPICGKWHIGFIKPEEKVSDGTAN